MSTLVLYHFFRSSCSWRVRAALAYKNIDYEKVSINMINKENRGEQYLAINPNGLIPTLIVNGVPLAESIAIMEYLEEAYPENPLLPKDLLKRAKVREICELLGSGIQPLQNPNVAAKHSADPKEQKEWQHFYINKGFSVLDKVLSKSAGSCCVGDQMTFADCCLVPQVYNAEQRFGVDISAYPNIVKVNDHLLSLEAFKVSHPDNQPDKP